MAERHGLIDAVMRCRWWAFIVLVWMLPLSQAQAGTKFCPFGDPNNPYCSTSAIASCQAWFRGNWGPDQNGALQRTIYADPTPDQPGQFNCRAMLSYNDGSPPFQDGHSVGIFAVPVDDTCDDKVGQVLRSGYFDIGTSANAMPRVMTCIPINGSTTRGCMTVFNGDSPAGSALVNGVKHYYAKGSYTAGSEPCGMSTKDTELAQQSGGMANDSCPPGQSKGTINSKSVCYTPTADGGATVTGDKGTATENTTRTESVATDGSKSVITETTKSDANGNAEKTTKTEIYDAAGKLVAIDIKTTPSNPNAGSGGSGSGSGNENAGPCADNPSAAGCGGSAAAVSTLYTGKGTTLQSVFDARKAQFQASGFGAAVGTWFNVSASASCPTWEATIPFINAHLVVDQFCQPFITNNLPLIKAVVICCMAFFAFRVAVE